MHESKVSSRNVEGLRPLNIHYMLGHFLAIIQCAEMRGQFPLLACDMCTRLAGY
jgi:hypothetical protein